MKKFFSESFSSYGKTLKGMEKTCKQGWDVISIIISPVLPHSRVVFYQMDTKETKPEEIFSLTNVSEDPPDLTTDKKTVPAKHFLGTVSINVDNAYVTDKGFRDFIRNTLPVVDYSRHENTKY